MMQSVVNRHSTKSDASGVKSGEKYRVETLAVIFELPSVLFKRFAKYCTAAR